MSSTRVRVSQNVVTVSNNWMLFDMDLFLIPPSHAYPPTSGITTPEEYIQWYNETQYPYQPLTDDMLRFFTGGTQATASFPHLSPSVDYHGSLLLYIPELAGQNNMYFEDDAWSIYIGSINFDGDGYAQVDIYMPGAEGITARLKTQNGEDTKYSLLFNLELWNGATIRNTSATGTATMVVFSPDQWVYKTSYIYRYSNVSGVQYPPYNGIIITRLINEGANLTIGQTVGTMKYRNKDQ